MTKHEDKNPMTCLLENDSKIRVTAMTQLFRVFQKLISYTKWDSFTPRKYKINLIRTLTYRCFRICSSPSLLQAAIKDLRKLLLQNGYPQDVITFNINDVLNKSKNKPNNSVQATVPKKDILIVLPYNVLRFSQ